MNWQQSSQNFTNQMQNNLMNIRKAQSQQMNEQIQFKVQYLH